MDKVEGQKVLKKALTEVKKKTKKTKKSEEVIKFLEEDQVPTKKPKRSLNNDEEIGLIYLSHIPHGFYEEQIKKYFKQFGRVKKVRVARSRNTGRSKGYAYVLFEDVAVAKVAAETMNNYLMCNRLLKACYVPKEKQRSVFYSMIVKQNFHKHNYPKLLNRKNCIKWNNRLTAEKLMKRSKRVKNKLHALENKLREEGIDIEFTTV